MAEIIGGAIGSRLALEKMRPEAGAANLAKSCPKYETHCFIFDGKLDCDTPGELVEGYIE